MKFCETSKLHHFIFCLILMKLSLFWALIILIYTNPLEIVHTAPLMIGKIHLWTFKLYTKRSEWGITWCLIRDTEHDITEVQDPIIAGKFDTFESVASSNMSNISPCHLYKFEVPVIPKWRSSFRKRFMTIESRKMCVNVYGEPW